MAWKEASAVEAAFKPLRDALRPRGTLPVTLLRVAPGTAVNASLVQSAIDEIIQHHTVCKGMGEPESACMQLAKLLLMDSAYMSTSAARNPEL